MSLVGRNREIGFVSPEKLSQNANDAANVVHPTSLSQDLRDTDEKWRQDGMDEEVLALMDKIDPQEGNLSAAEDSILPSPSSTRKSPCASTRSRVFDASKKRL